MTHDQSQEYYNTICMNEGPEIRKDFEATVERFRAGFFENGPQKCRGNYEESFARAVDSARRFMPIIRMRNGA